VDGDILQDMTDEALVRASLDETTYDQGFMDRISRELELRGLTIASFADHVLVRSSRAFDSCTIDESLQKLDRLELWDPIEWTNALKDRITIQRGTGAWLAHRQDEAGYAESARFDHHGARSALRSFLLLEPVAWQNAFELASWPIVDATSSRRFLKKISQELTDRKIEHIVVCPGPEADNATCDVRVPDDRSRAAEDVLSELYARIDKLQQQAVNLADTDQREKEREIYELLQDLVPGKPAILYNHASVLYELGELELAVEGLLEAMALGMPEEKLSQIRGNRTGLLQMVPVTSRTTRYPDYFADIEAYLLKVEGQLPDHTPLLHGLATLARIYEKFDRSLGYYARILDLDPEDQIAKTNLAMLQSSEDPE
jgi:tetratricopeptide (TPR) repeat protein